MEVEECAAPREGEARHIGEKLHLLGQYYAGRFPFEQLFEWLHCCTRPEDRCKREISYIARSLADPNEEFCIRNRGYRDCGAFREEVCKLTPLRIDVGPEFNFHPTEPNKAPLRREYVIDIDMSDYDGIRTCCAGKVLRRCCWTFMVAAYEVLDMLLREAFGFRHVLWVFSGRRGIHAWVCDPAAASMPNPLRKAVTNFLNFSLNSDKSSAMVKEELLRRRGYRLLGLVYDILKRYRRFLLHEQRVLQKREVFERVAAMAERYLPAPIGPAAREQLFAMPSAEEQFAALLALLRADGGEDAAARFEREFIIGFLYPKIDAHVSAEMNHLLKAPFNVHMDTLKLSVPLLNVAEFDPENCLTLEDLLLRGGVRGRESFAEYLVFFERFTAALRAAQGG